MDRADQMEQTARDANARADRAEEEVRNLQKKIQQIENEFDTCQEQLMAANTKLEEKEKALQNVSSWPFFPYLGIFELHTFPRSKSEGFTTNFSLDS